MKYEAFARTYPVTRTCELCKNILLHPKYVSGGKALNVSGCADTGFVRHPAVAKARESFEHEFRTPVGEDAGAIFALIASSPPLDPNSLYCNLLQCTHFASTCIVAERNGVIEGWISGYRPPDDPEAMFIWQVAVRQTARGCGLGAAMLDTLLQFPDVATATRLLTTVTPSNLASRRMFAAFAARHRTQMSVRPYFDRQKHFGGGHESEELISIGPLQRRSTTST